MNISHCTIFYNAPLIQSILSSLIVRLVTVARLINNLDLRLVNTPCERQRVSTEGIYKNRSALVATSAPHNSVILMCWNCFWRQTDWYNGVGPSGLGFLRSVWLTDLGSMWTFALPLWGVCAGAMELPQSSQNKPVFFWSRPKQVIDPSTHCWFLQQTG